MVKIKLGKHKNLIIISSIIIVLVIINIFLLLNPNAISQINPFADKLKNYKEIGDQVHWEILTLEESANSSITEKSDYVFLPEDTKRIANEADTSAIQDVQWIVAKENVFYEALQNTSSEEEAYDLMHKEIAVMFASDYIAALNIFSLDYAMQDIEIRNEIISDVEELEEITALDFMGDDFDLPEGIELDREKVKEETLKIIEEYVDFKENEFANASSRERKFIEAEKLLTIYYS